MTLRPLDKPARAARLACAIAAGMIGALPVAAQALPTVFECTVVEYCDTGGTCESDTVQMTLTFAADPGTAGGLIVQYFGFSYPAEALPDGVFAWQDNTQRLVLTTGAAGSVTIEGTDLADPTQRDRTRLLCR